MDERLSAILGEVARRQGRIAVLTGAGVSAESGIPTFRGKEGYWTVGAQVYQPQEMATRAMFERRPEDVWAWYLYRRGVCRAANPNAGHHAIVRLERGIGDRFRLLTQNVDGLHLAAGSSPERTYQVHGNISFRRCASECGAAILPVPEEIPAKAKGDALTSAERDLLRCPACGGWSRPHVLWFDESYDEERYRYESALAAAREADLLLVAGTRGATTLPVRAGDLAARS
ncbi:MAG: RNA polymerase subunit sigma, partial [Planctomycetes bacterium]|nr:RNA polymerase subunit sigma [Planctomycetota bacterium]